MRQVQWTDRNGWIRNCLVRDSDPDSAAPMGIPCEPPDLDLLDWEAAKRDLHNALVTTGIFTLNDIQKTQANLRSAIEIGFFRRLIALYQEQSEKVNGGSNGQ